MSKRLMKQRLTGTRSMAMMVSLAVASLLLAACAPTYSTRPSGAYGGPPTYGSTQCYQGCGYVRSIDRVRLDNRSGAILGTVIGALVGGAIGNQVGGGTGKKLATVAGAVGGGIAGHEIGENAGQPDVGWKIVVQLGNGRYATVTQRQPPRVQVGDYVMIRNDNVYRY